ncbi:MAG: hypothetical protein AAGF97_19995 [Planctomycetota bacterium]
MPQISLSVTDHEPMEFTGRRLVRVEGSRDPSSTGWRRYDLSVYTVEAGGFVAAIDFISTVPNEPNRSVVEAVDRLTDVEDFFFAFEPDELLPATIPNLSLSHRQELLQRLYANYDRQVKDVLNELHREASQPETTAPPRG